MEIVTGPKICSIDNVGTTAGLTPASRKNVPKIEAIQTNDKPMTKKQLMPLTSKTQMQELRNGSADLKQIEEAWRQFWFPKKDRPSGHLSPERIHGGVIRSERRLSDAVPIDEAKLR
jgi:hypothetical protein